MTFHDRLCHQSKPRCRRLSSATFLALGAQEADHLDVILLLSCLDLAFEDLSFLWLLQMLAAVKASGTRWLTPTRHQVLLVS